MLKQIKRDIRIRKALNGIEYVENYGVGAFINKVNRENSKRNIYLKKTNWLYDIFSSIFIKKKKIGRYGITS